MDIDSQPLADRTEVDRLLHQLRSTLARLKAEIELMEPNAAPSQVDAQDTVDEALVLLASVERLYRPNSPDILVVDDDSRLASATVKQLLRMGVHAQALSNLSAIPPSVSPTSRLIVDLGVLRLASQSQRDRLRPLLPIVVSGSTDPRARREALSYGAAAYFVKPVEPETLRDALLYPHQPESGGQPRE